MVKEKKTGSLIVISGPSGAGKDSIVNEVVKETDAKISVSMTTREKRKGEEEGKDYFFVTKEHFLEQIDKGNLLEFATVHGENYYGTPKDEVEKNINSGKDVILVIDIQGALKVKAKASDAIFIFIMPPSMKELKNRLIKRGTETKEQIIKRFKDAYQEINEATKYNYVVINDNLKDAVKKVEAIIMAEKCRVDRIEDFDLNSEEELMHELLTDKE